MDNAAQNNFQAPDTLPAPLIQSPLTAPQVVNQKSHKKLGIIIFLFIAIFLIAIIVFFYFKFQNSFDPTQQKTAFLMTPDHPMINKPNIITVLVINKQTTGERLRLDISPNILKINQVVIPPDTPIHIVLNDRIITGNLSHLDKNIEVNIDCRFDPTTNQWFANKVYIFNDL